MLTQFINKLDKPILELALIDAFCDMCFYEGVEVIEDLENYFEKVDTNTNTEDQDSTFLEISMPYIERSIMIYTEGVKDIKVGADITSARLNRGLAGSDKNTQTTPTGVTSLVKVTGLTESEEVAIWEGVGNMIIPSAKDGVNKAKKSLNISSNFFQKHLKGFKIGGKEATASPEKKKG